MAVFLDVQSKSEDHQTCILLEKAKIPKYPCLTVHTSYGAPLHPTSESTNTNFKPESLFQGGLQNDAGLWLLLIIFPGIGVLYHLPHQSINSMLVQQI